MIHVILYLYMVTIMIGIECNSKRNITRISQNIIKKMVVVLIQC